VDERQRALERSWRTSGSVDDEARWLVARVRAAELALDRLELAGCCDHPAARVALSALGVELSPTSWITDLRRWGLDVCLRSAAAAARRGLTAWESAFADDLRPQRGLRLVEDWLQARADPGARPPGPADDVPEVELGAAQAAELAQLELAEAAEYAGSATARLAEDACVSAYYAVRCLQAVAREAESEASQPTLMIPGAWTRRRPARRALSSQPPSVIDDFLGAERRAARARLEAVAVTRAAINAAIVAWCLG
jgi:hypothetical protein